MISKQDPRDKHLIRRLSAFFCALALILCLIPTSVQAANATRVYVGGVELNTTNPYLANGSATATNTQPTSGGYAYFDSSTATLTLNNASITESHINADGRYGIYADGDLNISLVGTNSIAGESDASYNYFGIKTDSSGNLTLDGTGSLLVTSSTAAANNAEAVEGIRAGGKLTINGGNITAKAGVSNYGARFCDAIVAGDNIIINGGTVNAIGGKSNGDLSGGSSSGILSFGSTTINGGTVNASGGSAPEVESYGIFSNSTISITGGTVNISGDLTANYSSGLQCSVFSMTGGVLSATGKTVALHSINSSTITIAPMNGSVEYNAKESTFLPATWDANAKKYYIGNTEAKTLLIGRAPVGVPSAVNTGDDSGTLLWTGIMIISLLSLASGIVFKQKKRNEL